MAKPITAFDGDGFQACAAFLERSDLPGCKKLKLATANSYAGCTEEQKQALGMCSALRTSLFIRLQASVDEAGNALLMAVDEQLLAVIKEIDSLFFVTAFHFTPKVPRPSDPDVINWRALATTDAGCEAFWNVCYASAIDNLLSYRHRPRDSHEHADEACAHLAPRLFNVQRGGPVNHHPPHALDTAENVAHAAADGIRWFDIAVSTHLPWYTFKQTMRTLALLVLSQDTNGSISQRSPASLECVLKAACTCVLRCRLYVVDKAHEKASVDERALASTLCGWRAVDKRQRHWGITVCVLHPPPTGEPPVPAPAPPSPTHGKGATARDAPATDARVAAASALTPPDKAADAALVGAAPVPSAEAGAQ